MRIDARRWQPVQVAVPLCGDVETWSWHDWRTWQPGCGSWHSNIDVHRDILRRHMNRAVWPCFAPETASCSGQRGNSGGVLFLAMTCRSCVEASHCLSSEVITLPGTLHTAAPSPRARACECRFPHASRTVQTALSGGGSAFTVAGVNLRPRSRGASTYREPKPAKGPPDELGPSGRCSVQARDCLMSVGRDAARSELRQRVRVRLRGILRARHTGSRA